ncbi:MAG: P-II family nitrogen regulator [Treponema sp.]|jgi:nitrogen regulatory protein PII|nr:P-II family nitrogen regulator [Treponema sp.]
MDDIKNQPALPVIKLLIFIIDWNKTKMVSSVFENEHVRFHFISKGRGTASSEILDVLGIGSSEKAVVLCLEQDVMVPVLLKEVRKKVGFQSTGAGIAFTVPLSGINHPILQVFKDSIHKNDKIVSEKEKEADKMGTEIKHDLILSIINQGYSDEFMTVAREAGATGGTVINARGLAHQGPVKFFGVSVQDEKEIIIIVTNRDKKAPIMQAICQAYGITSKAEGVIFSLPVDKIMGLNLDLE